MREKQQQKQLDMVCKQYMAVHR